LPARCQEGDARDLPYRGIALCDVAGRTDGIRPLGASLSDVWISNEAPRVFPDIAARAGTPGPPGHFLLAVNGAPVAWTDPHGASIEWLGEFAV
jgi:hypothetical protein